MPASVAAQIIDLPADRPDSAPNATAPPVSSSANATPASGTRPILLPVTVRSEDMSLLLEIRLNDLVLVEALPSYIKGSSIVLPLRELSSALDFPISVESRAGRASG